MLLSTRETVSDRVSVSAPRWVVFTCGGARYGIPAAGTLEILEPRRVVRIPGCGPEVAGLVTVRGRVLSLFELRQLTAGEPAEGRPQILVCGDGAREAGLIVDRVLAVAPSGLSEATEPQRVPSRGEGRYEGRAFTALDVAGLLDYLFE